MATRKRPAKAAKPAKGKPVTRSKSKKTRALAELLIAVCDKVGVEVTQDVWLIAEGVPKAKKK